MEYKKKFNKDVTKVTITFSHSTGIWDLNRERWVKEKTFDVIKKEETYKKIKEGAPLNLRGKYIEYFSLFEYRAKNDMGEFDQIHLKDLNAEGAFFEEGADFGFADFTEGNVDFSHITLLNGKFNFLGSSFKKGDMYFSFTNLGSVNIDCSCTNFDEGIIYFIASSLSGVVIDFMNSKLDNLIFANLNILEDFDMRVEKANLISFEDVKIYGNIDFSDYFTGGNDWLTPKVKILELKETKLYGKIHINYDDFRLGKVINSQGNTTTHKQKKEQFRLFKENFHTLGQYDDEDKAYVQFMKHKIRHEAGFNYNDSVWGKIKKVMKSPVFIFKWLVFEQMGLYGTSPFRVFLSMLIAIGGFSWMYSQLPPPLNGSPYPIFHSIITFLTIGYGTDYINMNSWAAKIFSGLEGFAGLFLMSYFTISFVRKVLR